jgi:hypothetical protein
MGGFMRISSALMFSSVFFDRSMPRISVCSSNMTFDILVVGDDADEAMPKRSDVVVFRSGDSC